MKNLLYILISLIALAACKGEEKPEFDIRGMWMLKCIRVVGFNDINYDTHENSVPTKIFTDSAYYVAYQHTEPSRFLFSPSYCGKYKLINKGSGEYLYFEDNDRHQLTVVNDTVINVQDVGRVCEWHRISDVNNANAKDMRSVVELLRDKWEEEGSTYIFTERERSLKSDKQNLTAITMCIILAFILLAYYTRNLFRNKARIEQQLRQIREEQESRPIVVKEAMKSVEDEFLHSEFYTSVRQRISRGERLKKADWSQMEQQINSTYTGFSNRLINLYPLSQTEMQTCLLIKLRVPTSEIANTLNKSASAISSTRSRLYEKVFHRKGSAKDWDEFILSL